MTLSTSSEIPVELPSQFRPSGQLIFGSDASRIAHDRLTLRPGVGMAESDARSVRLDRGQVYVVCAVVNGALRDPWCFTQYIDAQVKLEEIKIAGERDAAMDIQAAIYKVRVVDQGVDPVRDAPEPPV